MSARDDRTGAVRSAAAMSPAAVPRPRRPASPARSRSAPSLLAACGGDDDDSGSSGGGGGGGGGKDLAISNWTGYMTDQSLKRLRDDRPGITRQLRRGHQRQQRVLRQDPPEPVARARASAATASCSPTGWRAGSSTRSTVGAAVRRRRSSRTRRTCVAALADAGLRPDAQVQRAVGERHDRASRTTSSTTGKEITHDRRLPRRRRARRRSSTEMRDTVGLFMLVDRRRHRRSRRTTAAEPAFDALAEGGRRRQDRRLQRQRLRRTTSAPGTSPPRSRGRATSRRSRSTTRTCASRSRSRAGCSGPTTS